MIAGLLLFLVLPLGVGGAVYATRRWATVSFLLAFGTCIALAAIIHFVPLGQTVDLGDRQIVMGGRLALLGRELVLDAADRIALAFLYLAAAGVFAVAWRVSPRSMIFPMGFGSLSLLSGSLLIQPLIYGVLLVQLAIALSIFALQPEDRGPTRGGLHYLSFSLLALPGLMVIHWLMERYALTPENTALLDTSAILFALSFALLLGSIPFHMWMPAVTSDSDPLAGAFVLTVNHGAIWFLLLSFLEVYPQISAYPQFASLASTVGLVMVGLGGLLAAAQRNVGRLVGYGALIDSGVALVALGMNSERGLALALLALMVRPFGLVLMTAGLQGLRTLRRGRAQPASMPGLAWKAPLSTFAFVMGGLSIAGMPVTAGFAGRWPLYRALAASNLGSVLLMIFAGVGLMIGVWRALSPLIERPQTAEGEPGEEELTGGREGGLSAVVIGAVMMLSLCVALWPQIVNSTAMRLASMYTFFAP